MRHLLDINLLIALLDPDHAFHEAAHTWWAKATRAWASCPLTENGLIRIMASPGYSQKVRFTVLDLTRRLETFVQTSDHEFWPASFPPRESRRLHHDLILSAKHLTDLYLLALAVERGGCLATFDRHIPLAAAVGASRKHLLVL